ncbi:MAG: choice-of-anchor J domain-containing protein [Chitinophagaceae bacterium]|nr:choice-of-anchor J domain-containing protein [Chitinophagaceae bacterium]MCZ2395649.1 choice-of-anchor J domain-containing protein [Chitinophagales bacterium]
MLNPLIRRRLVLTLLILTVAFPGIGQQSPKPHSAREIQKCGTMLIMEASIRNNPDIVKQWQLQGEKKYHEYLTRKSSLKGILNDTIIIPVVFHLIDQADKLAMIPDRTLYDQLEMMNEAFNGTKADMFRYVIPEEIYNLTGRIPVRFVMARRDPLGNLTSGIERKTGSTPDYIKIKSAAEGGLNAWNTDKYLNVWAGTLPPVGGTSILGVGTFPFTNDIGPQGVVVDIKSLSYTTNTTRSYYPTYSEGVTLIHEVGHYLYLWHTFGDQTVCNNTDFRIQAGWPLAAGAGPEGDDTPAEKADAGGRAHFGLPSMNYSDGCTTESSGEMYGSIMNYFDDRALFMFSEGHGRRVLSTIEYYRPDLANSDGATPPTSTTDAYVVSAMPYGNIERRAYIKNNTPLTAKLRNYGNTPISSIQLTVKIDGTLSFSQVFSVSLLPGKDTILPLGNINAVAGTHLVEIISSNPNGDVDAFTANDTLQSLIIIAGLSKNAPFVETFSSPAFPPEDWTIWNPNSDATWTYDGISGYNGGGAASMKFFTYNKPGALDELIMPPINIGSADSSVLSFKVAYGAYDMQDVSVWDGLEIYLSYDDGRSYQLVYRKSGTYLASVAGNSRTSFIANTNGNWKYQEVNLSPFIVPGKDFLIKFRALNGYGNNLYLDDVGISSATRLNRDVTITGLTGVSLYNCDAMPTPVISVRSNGKDPINSVKINYRIDEMALQTFDKNLSLTQNNSTIITLPTLATLPPGGHNLTIYTSMPNGLADEAPQNDTVMMRFYVIGKSDIPLEESFESATMPPAQWVIQPSVSGLTWEKSTLSASKGISSVMVNNYLYNGMGKGAHLISPRIHPTKDYDSLFLYFDYAYAPGINYPGITGDSEDTLEVKLTLDCGQTFTTLFKKYGNEMVTVEDPDAQKLHPFVAASKDWLTVKIYLNPVVGKSDFQVFFSAKGHNRNNLYLDNINLLGITVPPLLKEKGYLFYPSPFQSQFIIRNYEQPTDLRSIQIYNAIGQLVWYRTYNGDAYRQILVNTPGWAPGLYTVKMNFTDRKVVEKVLKQ